MKKSIADKIKFYCEKGNVLFTKHALERLLERSIAIETIIDIIENGEIIKNYQQDKPLPSYLILGYTKSGEPVHMVIALDDNQGEIWIITVYRPYPDLWDSSFKRRIK